MRSPASKKKSKLKREGAQARGVKGGPREKGRKKVNYYHSHGPLVESIPNPNGRKRKAVSEEMGERKEK